MLYILELIYQMNIVVRKYTHSLKGTKCQRRKQNATQGIPEMIEIAWVNIIEKIKRAKHWRNARLWLVSL